jgi:hypothetical protein
MFVLTQLANIGGRPCSAETSLSSQRKKGLRPELYPMQLLAALPLKAGDSSTGAFFLLRVG